MELNSSTDLFGSSRSLNRLSSYFNTKLEKRLLASLIFFISATLILLIAIIVVSTKHPEVTKADRDDVCESETCDKVSKDIHSFIDTGADPCEDFYDFTCGKWVKSYNLTDTSLESGPTAFSQRKINNKIRAFLEGKVNPENSTAVAKAISYFETCSSGTERGKSAALLKDMLKSKGLSFPLIDEGGKVNPMKLIAAMNRYDFPGRIYSIKTRADDISRQRSLIQISPSATNELHSLPETKLLYYKLMRSVFNALNLKYTEETVNNITSFQKELFEIAYSTRTSFVRYSFNELEVKMMGIPWRVLLHDFNTLPLLVIPTERRYQLTEEYIRRTYKLIDADPETAANYLGWKILQHLAPFTTPQLRQESFNLDNVYYRVPEQKDLIEQCTLETINYFRFAVGKMFYDLVADKEERTGVELIMSYVKKAYNKRMNESDWLDDQTRAVVLRKLKGILVDYYMPAAFSLHVTWDRRPPFADIDSYYKTIEQPKEDDNTLLLVEWVLTMHKFQFNIGIAELLATIRNQSPASYSWERSPTEISAAYITAWNLLLVPVSVLAGPWYQRGRPEAMNFGSLGFMLAHEVAHAFDPTSYQYNYNGERKPDDWSLSCRQQHVEKRKCFVDQYRGFKFMGHTIDPDRTMIENIADGEGLRLAFEAFKLYRENHPENKHRHLPPPMHHYSEEQLFFLSFAHSMCWKFRNTNYFQAMAQVDPHAPRKIRVLGSVMNSEFGSIFSCSDPSRLNPKTKCSFW